jgi:adenylate kinase family enzyme
VTKLQVRDDDTREVIASRMREYAEKTEPMLGEFSRRGVLMEF